MVETFARDSGCPLPARLSTSLVRLAGYKLAGRSKRRVGHSSAELGGCPARVLEDHAGGVIPAWRLGARENGRAVGHERELEPGPRGAVREVESQVCC